MDSIILNSVNIALFVEILVMFLIIFLAAFVIDNPKKNKKSKSNFSKNALVMFIFFLILTVISAFLLTAYFSKTVSAENVNQEKVEQRLENSMIIVDNLMNDPETAEFNEQLQDLKDELENTQEQLRRARLIPIIPIPGGY